MALIPYHANVRYIFNNLIFIAVSNGMFFYLRVYGIHSLNPFDGRN